jgi:DNA-binding XRE family transcriptional regulator
MTLARVGAAGSPMNVASRHLGPHGPRRCRAQGFIIGAQAAGSPYSSELSYCSSELVRKSAERAKTTCRPGNRPPSRQPIVGEYGILLLSSSKHVIPVFNGRSALRRSHTYSPQTKDAARVLGLRIAEGRRRRRWTQAELCERAGVSKATLRNAERGEPTVAVGVMFELATLVGV